MVSDFACDSVLSGLSQIIQISYGRCISVVLSTIFGIHTPLVLKAFTTVIVTIMIRDTALSFVAWILNVRCLTKEIFCSNKETSLVLGASEIF